jgi:hypothetical protein
VVLLVGGVQEAVVKENRLIRELEECIRRVVEELRRHNVPEDDIVCSLQLAYLWYCPYRVEHANPNAPDEMVEEMRAYARARADELFRRCEVQEG